jgi:AraC-like DNA-binding protein
MEQAPLSVSLAYVEALLAAASVPAEQALALLRHLGVDTNDHTARLDPQQFATLYRSVATSLDDEMLRCFSRPLRPGTLKFTCLALLDAKNVKVALHRWSHLSRLMQDDLYIEVIERGDTTRIAIAQAPGAPPSQRFALDLMLKGIHGVSSWLAGQRLALARADFPFARPAYDTDHALLYPGPVFYGQPQAALEMEASLLQLPVRRSKPELDVFLRHAPEGWMFATPCDPGMAARLRDYLGQRLPLPATAEHAAETLRVSARTLHRRLAGEGTSFQRVKDEFRRDRALQLLTRSQTSIHRISEQLGFDSTASFHRAFRGWTGETPGAFRAAGAPPR